MLLKYLEYLEAVYRHRSFTKAGEELYMSQPAISMAIRKLEESLGVELVVRSNRSVVFTYEGECFMRHAYRILEEVQMADEVMRDLSGKQKKTLRLGLSPTVDILTKRIYTNFIPRLARNETIFIDEAGALEHKQKILEESLDIALNAVVDLEPEKHLDFIPIDKSELFLMMSEHHPLAGLERIPFERLDGESMASMDESTGVSHCMMRECQRVGVTPNIMSMHIRMSSYIEAIASGTCTGIIAITPFSDYDKTLRSRKMIIRPFEENLLLDIGFLLKKGRYVPDLAKKFIAFVRDEFKY